MGVASCAGVRRARERSNTPWRPIGETEDGFWLHHAALEFLTSRFPAFRSVNEASEELGRLIIDATDPLPSRDWTWPGRRQHVRFRGDSLAMVCQTDGYFWIQVGAAT